MKFLRIIVQLFFIQFILYTGIMTLVSNSRINCESYCPNGIVATIIPSLKNGSMICSMTELNLAVFIGVVLIVLLAGRAFCSWICPLGTISEWLAALGKKMGISRKLPREYPGKIIFSLKYIVLLLIIIFSALNVDLVFRKFCPYFTLFSFHGHEVEVISYFVLGNILIAGVVFPLFWCRVLCPLNAFFRILGIFPFLRVFRDKHKCNGCGKCDRVCLEEIEVSSVETVKNGACTNCMNCVDSCPKDALEVGVYKSKKLPTWIIPLVTVGLITGSVYASGLIRIPSLEVVYEKPSDSVKVEKAVFVVDGMRCRTSAKTLSKLVKEGGGVISLKVYTAAREVILEYNAEELIPEELIYRFDRDIKVKGRTIHPFRCLRYKTGDMDSASRRG